MILVSKAVTYATALLIAVFYLSSQLWLGLTLHLNGESGYNLPLSVDGRNSIRQSSSDASFPPLEVLQQYKKVHGNRVLRQELNNDPSAFANRKFLVVYYSCPHEAGNLLHDFYNQVLAGIALNQTVLLKYNNQETCANSRLSGKNQTRCFKANTQEECEQSLLKADWLPMYDEWIEHIASGDESALPLRDSKSYTLRDWRYKNLVAIRPSQFYIPGALGSIWRDAVFGQTPNAKETLLQLYSQGADLLYGMLYHELLSFHPQISPPEVQQYGKLLSTTKTFVLHSRHAKNSDTGDDVQEELQCLKQILPKNRPSFRQSSQQNNCIIYLMSDRETTIDLLKEHVHKRYPHCTPVVATHGAAPSNGHYQEHGTWAGTGFLQDLMLGAQAKDGFIGHCHRSSSQLLREMVEYNRHFGDDGGFNSEVVPPLPTCCLS